MRTLSSAVVAVAIILTVGISAQVQKNDVDIKAPDGVNLKGTYFSSGRTGPAILLLHQCNMNRHAWDELASDLAGAGFNVLTVDFRGFGESGGEHFSSFAQHRPVMAEKWPGDVDAMYAYLLSRNDVEKSRVAVGGASCGVTQSSDLVARRPEIKTLMVLSGTGSDIAKGHIAKTPALAIFGAAAEEDANAAKGIRDILAASKSPQSQLKMYAGAEHGVPMFAKNPELRPTIVTWFRTQLLSKAGSK